MITFLSRDFIFFMLGLMLSQLISFKASVILIALSLIAYFIIELVTEEKRFKNDGYEEDFYNDYKEEINE